jgi:outer membrane lipoprotein-sorting protein
MKTVIRHIQPDISTVLLLTAAIFLGLPGAAGIAHAKELSALEVMQRVEDRDEGDNMISEMTMVLIDKRGNERIRRIKSHTKFKGKDKRQIMFFLHPADVKGTGFLTYDYDDDAKDDDQWLFLPALRKSKRIASGDKDGSFMGSDLTYADMTSRNLPDYEFKLMKDAEVGGKPCYVISSVPNKKAKDETGYEKSIIFVRKDNFVVVRALNWIIKGKKQKYLDVKKLELIDNIWTATEIHVFTKKNKNLLHKTILQFKNVKYNQNLDDSMFTVRRLEKGL